MSSPGVTYAISRIEASGGAKGWWFRSGYHFMNQAMNPGIDPTLREVVLLEPAGAAPVSLEEVIGAYVQVPQDRATLLRNQRREKSPK